MERAPRVDDELDAEDIVGSDLEVSALFEAPGRPHAEARASRGDPGEPKAAEIVGDALVVDRGVPCFGGAEIKRTLGIARPIHSTSAVWKRAYERRTLGGEIIPVDQSRLYDQLVGLVQGAMQPPLKDSVFANGQLRSYMRTPVKCVVLATSASRSHSLFVSFYVAQLLSANGFPCIVLGTGNYDEDGYLRYFCKAGDGTVDVQLIADLHKSEVFAVARELGVPQR